MAPTVTNTIQYVTTSTLGNAADFGDLTVANRGASIGSSSNAVRGIWGGGYAPTVTDTIQYVTLATLGDAIDFGNLSNGNTSMPAGTASPTRVIIAGGGTTVKNDITYVQIATTGDSVDFGDLTLAREQPAGVSNGHGGLG